MATARTIRVTIKGDRTGTWAGEVWQTGFSIAGADDWGGDFDPVVDATLGNITVNPDGSTGAWSKGTYTLGAVGPVHFTQAEQAATAVAAWDLIDGVKGLMPSDMRATEVTLAALQDNGKVINGASVFTIASPLVGTASATTQMPPEVAIVASLRTGGRGPRNRGRMFLPLSSATNASGLVASGSLTTIVTEVKALAEALMVANPGAGMAVVHQAGLTYSSITRVQAGNHWDAQRRRQNALPETRTELAVTF